MVEGFCAWGALINNKLVLMADTFWFCFRRHLFCFFPWLLLRLFSRSRKSNILAQLLLLLLCLFQLSVCRQMVVSYGYVAVVLSPGISWPVILMATSTL